MEQKATESKLTIAYGICVILGAISSITCGIAWGHWKDTLDQCVEKPRNCSCILYGRHTPSHFLGGEAGSCIWVTFGPLLYILFALAFTCFHGYRVLFDSGKTTKRTITTRNEAGETVVMQAVHNGSTSILPRGFWIFKSVITAIFTVYALVHFSIFVDGYLSTCRQYRITLERYLGVHGTLIPVIHNRLSCSSVFDFMDYIQPDTGNAYRDGFINTAASLLIGIISAWVAWMVFLFSAILNIMQSRQKY